MIPTFAGTINESVLSPPSHEPEIALGRVGWPGDDDIVDLGTADNDGATLLKVTLHRGGYPGDIPKPGEAAGYRVRVRVMGPVFDVPPKGTEVCVAFPGGIGMVAGAGVLLGRLQRTPEIQFNATKTKLDVGPDQDLVLKGRSVTISDYENRFLAVGPDTGMLMSDADGTTVQMKDRTLVIMVPGDDKVARAVLSLSVDAIGLVHKSDAGMTVLQMGDAKFQALGLQGMFVFGATLIGAAATPATAAVVGVPSSSGSAGVASTSVFISP